MTEMMTAPVFEPPDTDDTCPACHGRGFVGDFDDVTYCDAPGCFAWQDTEPAGVCWEDEYHPGTHYAPYGA